jgi:aerobic carbon-monoxide dehydrogenase large subunit
MDDYVDETMLDLERYAIGQPVPRSEDPVLLRGEGHYADDVNLPGQAHAVMVRSGYAHGFIRAIDSMAARGMPGVLGVYTAAELEKGGISPLPPRQVMNNRNGTPMLSPVRYALAKDKVRHVGEAIAAVVAETLAQAKDAAEAVEVEIEPLPAVTTPSAAAAPGAPILYDDVPGNVGLDFHFGDSDKVAAAFASAAHVTRLQLRNNRCGQCDGAAFGDRAIRPRAPALDALCRVSGRLRLSQLYRRRVGHRAQSVARTDGPRRRLVWYEAADLCRVLLHSARRA